MNFNEYQKKAKSTAIYPQSEALLYVCLGLCGEAGEMAEKAKKMIRDDAGILYPERKEAMKKELGDVLWYVAMLAHELDSDLSEIAELNIRKLDSRSKRGKIQGSGDDR